MISKAGGKRNLDTCAFGIAQQYRNGTLTAVTDGAWRMTWNHMLKDLRTCCPGFSEIEYGIALNQAFVANNADSNR